MGIEFHMQPEWLTKYVEVSNLVFSVIFSIEMMLKLSAYGFFRYISDGFNVFDGLIVILRFDLHFLCFKSGLIVM
jgi:voltage-dependent calcium channel T type alpha-1G